MTISSRQKVSYWLTYSKSSILRFSISVWALKNLILSVKIKSGEQIHNCYGIKGFITVSRQHTILGKGGDVKVSRISTELEDKIKEHTKWALLKHLLKVHNLELAEKDWKTKYFWLPNWYHKDTMGKSTESCYLCVATASVGLFPSIWAWA